MTCKCLTDLPNRIMAHCNDQKDFKKNPVLKAAFKNVVFPMDNKGQLTTALKNDIELTIEGRKTPKITTITFTYCPFCGVKYKEDAKQEV